MNLNELSKEIYQENKAKGFWEQRERHFKLNKECFEIAERAVGGKKERLKEIEKANNAQMIALMHSELSEALEADRKDLMDDKLPHRKGLEVELADTLIRICDMCGGLGLDLDGAVREKREYNKNRPYKHGKDY